MQQPDYTTACLSLCTFPCAPMRKPPHLCVRQHSACHISHVRWQVVLSNLILGICAGPLLGMFLLGMLSERTNSEGALIGVLCGVAVMLYCERC